MLENAASETQSTMPKFNSEESAPSSILKSTRQMPRQKRQSVELNVGIVVAKVPWSAIISALNQR
jgi:hypothetical protein